MLEWRLGRWRETAGCKDTGVSTTASEHDKHEETEQETRKRKVAGNVKVKGRERELAG